MHGGYREGAGRKKGSSHKVSLSTIQEIMKQQDFKSPLEIILTIMHEAYQKEDYKLALEAAKGAAPYMHAKPNEVNNTYPLKKLNEMTDEELKSLIS